MINRKVNQSIQKLVQRSSRHPEGQSMVEFAISLIFLMTLLAGVVDLGRVVTTYIALRDAAQEGAAFGSTHPTFCTQVKERIKSSSSSPIDLNDLTNNDIQVSIQGVDCDTAVYLGLACAPNEIKVEVTLDNFPLSMPFIGGILGSQALTLKTNVADTIITNPCSGP